MAAVTSLPRGAGPNRREDRGAALLIALLFMTVGSLLAISLANSAGNNLLNTSTLRVQRSLEYAADGGLDGAIQSARYHNGACLASFPPSGSPPLQVTSGLYVNVQCSGTPIEVTTTTNSSILASAGGGLFVPQDSGMLVSGSCIPGTPAVTYISPTQLSMTPAKATGNCGSTSPNPPVVAASQQRTDLFLACVSSSPISMCSSSSAVGTAIVTFSDTDSTGNTVTGYNFTVQSWVVHTANG